MAHWITTHWPVETSDFSRHVYVKARTKTVPQPEDTVLVRESRTVNGKGGTTAVRCHRGKNTPIRLPPGFGGIIGVMTVMGVGRRLISPEDVVYDYGDLPEWSIIECRNFRPARLPLDDLMDVLGRSERATYQFLRLWRVPDHLVPLLMSKLLPTP